MCSASVDLSASFDIPRCYIFPEQAVIPQIRKSADLHTTERPPRQRPSQQSARPCYLYHDYELDAKYYCYEINPYSMHTQRLRLAKPQHYTTKPAQTSHALLTLISPNCFNPSVYTLSCLGQRSSLSMKSVLHWLLLSSLRRLQDVVVDYTT